MSSACKVITAVSQEPITLSEAKAYLNVDFADDDGLIGRLIARARSLGETISARALATQTIQEDFTVEAENTGLYRSSLSGLDSFNESQSGPWGNQASSCFTLSMPPLQSITSIETRATMFDDFVAFTGTKVIDDTSEPARVYIENPVSAVVWRFTYVAGYSDSYIMPHDLRQGLYEAIAYWYQYREAKDVPQAIKELFLAKRSVWV